MWLWGSRRLVRQVKLLGGLLQLEVWAKIKKTDKNHKAGESGGMALLLKSKDIIHRRTCTMPLIGQKNPKRLDIDLRMQLIIKRFFQNHFSVWALERWPGLE